MLSLVLRYKIKMKRTIFLMIFLGCYLTTKAQSVVGYIPATKEIVLCTDNINLTTEYSPFGLYTIYDWQSAISQTDQRYYFPRALGVNFAIAKNGINVGAGASVKWLPNDEYEVYPDFLIRVHPLKLLTQNYRCPDISLMLNISKTPQFGIGISIPYRLNAL